METVVIFCCFTILLNIFLLYISELFIADIANEMYTVKVSQYSN